MIEKHSHTCCRCTFEWTCYLRQKRTAKVCPVDQAAKVNTNGPHCDLCIHILMRLLVRAHVKE